MFLYRIASRQRHVLSLVLSWKGFQIKLEADLGQVRENVCQKAYKYTHVFTSLLCRITQPWESNKDFPFTANGI